MRAILGIKLRHGTSRAVSTETPSSISAARIDVSREELEALLEGVRPALGEAGYQKLQAAIRTLNYVTELLETSKRYG